MKLSTIRVRLELPTEVGFVALRQNKPAPSGRHGHVDGNPLRRSALRYLSQRDKFHPTA